MDLLSESISKVVSSGSIVNYDNVLDIAYGVDRNFLFGAAISMQSVIMHNPEIGIRFHLFTDYINDDYLERVSLFTKKNSNAQVCIYKVSSVFIDIFPSLKQWSYATFFRLVAFQFLSDSIENLLYIDADVICKGPLDKLLTIHFEKNVCAAVIKDVPFMQDKPARRLGIEGLPGNYFNAGVVYLKLDAWKKNNYMDKALTMLASDPEHEKYKCLDQDILNVLFFGHCIFISGDYDCFYGIDYELKNKTDKDYIKIITAETKLIHYVGVTKPWNNWTDYPCQKYFNKAYNLSCWNDVSFIPAITEKQFQAKYKHELKNKKYFSAVIDYMKFYKKKILRKYFSKY
ncbi:UDP-galactose--(galactosyl) LPS alpha1,2-galactosyltransferase [Citrobacter amalonaticus]|uniref:UDP-galactose--(Galactosyl) LPS alpha1,2-galactosyltransferase n=1 Tax=Citrobacter amalonaticus TaxID=35703 RepID=A0A2S4RV91_CITAM|nr:glycosyltransferase [Citrobacter amalonaticus]POT55637.1 UDP-galactose--(galactosyl) LPS alpha1,2-galactosyltransferase [Citrobacter amalonaticus]POT73849.1 UDP-galactose--(galactosyl) LPS alpha1,2-galactosyltransferase [Citrobacter amalonaticus]POU64074.1 UDP-galactose--(galactosyl) LPS alpha1,2-galactosyltransferase [Citrobacter amalonaticus]POV03706.1 UDP-galactose--(galactosyl) LPS alpha1,2-galactosyltransferase [Citrobacter amalonaticus]